MMTEAASKPLLVVLGNQLFPIERLNDVRFSGIFMAEDMGLCTYERHHQQKIVLFLAAMRHHADALREHGFTIHYYELDPDDRRSYEDKLRATIEDGAYDEIVPRTISSWKIHCSHQRAADCFATA